MARITLKLAARRSAPLDRPRPPRASTGTRAMSRAALGEEQSDIDTADLLTAMPQQHEKHGWLLRATLGV